MSYIDGMKKLGLDNLGLFGIGDLITIADKYFDEISNGITHIGSRKFLKKIGVEVPQLDTVHKRVLVLGLNHESAIESIALLAANRFDKMKFIGIRLIANIHSTTIKLMYQVMPTIYAKDKMNWWQKMKAKTNPLKWWYIKQSLNYDEIMNRNMRAFDEAAKWLNTGGSLTIFVTGGNPIDAKWGRGVGEIIRRIDREQAGKIDIVVAKFGTIDRKLLLSSVLKFVRGRVKTPLKMDVTMGKPVKLLKLIPNYTDMDSGELVTALKQKLNGVDLVP